ncbi:hypothetical protein HYW58_01980 [Candidatus Kaiserbacteria bacterium]|nr:hypothetical protein [Candidatus Kaiserbacteria bacterium]
MNHPGEQVKEIAIRSLAVVGFLAVLSLGLWGTVQVVRLTPAIFSSLAAVTTTLTSVFIPRHEEITINTPDSLILTGNVFELTWSYRNKPVNVLYTFSYACEEGFSFELSNNGGVYEAVPCDAPFSFTSDTDVLRLIPLSKDKRLIEVPVIISSVRESGDIAASRELTLTIANEFSSESGSTKSTGAGQAASVAAGERTDTIFPITDSRTTSNPLGEPDLTVSALRIGIINSENEFVPADSVRVSDRAAVRFEVSNIGTKTSDNWTFNAVLPTFPMHIFHSTSQQTLAPGERIEFTLGFDQLNKNLSEGVVTINVDPTYSIKEASEENNVRQITFVISK